MVENGEIYYKNDEVWDLKKLLTSHSSL